MSEVIEFLGQKVSLDIEANHLVTENGDRFADLRAWSELRKFIDPKNVMLAHKRMSLCDKLQVEIGNFLIEAINEKIERESQ